MTIHDVSGSTRVLGVFGYPVEHSLSPEMHNTALRFMNLDYVYLSFAVHPDDIGGAVKSIKALGIAGVNITIPHKISVIPYLDVLSQEAELIGAVNTICNREGVLYGYNTDGQGFIQSLKRDAGVDPKGRNIVILGSGGAARGIGISLALQGAGRIAVASRNIIHGVELVNSMAKANPECECVAVELYGPELAGVIKHADVLVNATPVGMYPNVSEPPVVDESFLHDGLLVCDLVYNPMCTCLLQSAERVGASVLSGVGMLAYQGALALQLWTGKEPPFELMKDVLVKKFKN
jgi:shikimate dehydrogenase